MDPTQMMAGGARPEYFGNTSTRVLLAVCTQTRPTIQSVADEVCCADSTAHAHLKRLAAAGLVLGPGEGRKGVLRPAVGMVA